MSNFNWGFKSSQASAWKSYLVLNLNFPPPLQQGLRISVATLCGTSCTSVLLKSLQVFVFVSEFVFVFAFVFEFLTCQEVLQVLRITVAQIPQHKNYNVSKCDSSVNIFVEPPTSPSTSVAFPIKEFHYPVIELVFAVLTSGCLYFQC